MPRVSKPDGIISIRRSGYGVTLSLTMPGHAGWIVTRATLSEALAALAENIAPRDAAQTYGSARGEA